MATAAQQHLGRSNKKLSHGDRVDEVVSRESLLSEPGEIADSWRRCLVDYRVDAKSRSAPHIVTQDELKVSREPAANMLVQAQEEMDRLFAVVRQQAYVVLLCNSDGVAVHHRGDEARAEEFKKWGIWVGGVWSEQAEGTNGIGTCIADRRPVLVHCGQHFRSRHTQLSCAGAPIFDPHGQLTGVLDVSRVDREGDNRPFPLVLGTTIVSARAIEERMFREHFCYAWTIAAAPSDDYGAALLLAVDNDHRILGADRVAREAFALSDKKLTDGVHLSMLFEYDPLLFRRHNGQDIPLRLMGVGVDRRSWCGLLTPPLSRSSVAPRWAEAVLHSRPRISTLGHLPIAESPARSRGGLPPGLTRRICDYIESNLGQKIGLAALAAMSGLSTFHFARAFHQSMGIPPHSYVLRRRLEQVKHMLRETQLPLSEIALATGFSDQSHLARHFHRLTGVSPSVARWQAR
jgi:AraC-like DNA-binding protein/PAS domain-containing protein